LEGNTHDQFLYIEALGIFGVALNAAYCRESPDHVLPKPSPLSSLCVEAGGKEMPFSTDEVLRQRNVEIRRTQIANVFDDLILDDRLVPPYGRRHPVNDLVVRMDVMGRVCIYVSYLTIDLKVVTEVFEGFANPLLVMA
jgi:hypothetical protein